MKIRNSLLEFAGMLLLAAGLSTLCAAQSTPYRTRVTVTQLKPDMINEWVDLQKDEVVPALKKAGVKTRNVLSSGLFGRTGEYAVSQPFDNTAEFDGQSPLVKALDAPGATRLTSKLNKCIVSQYSYMNTRLDDISNVLPKPPEVLVSVRYRIAPGKMQEFHDIVKSDILPVYKKAKVQLTVNQRGAGANTTDVTMITGYAKYAEMNGGAFLTQQLGADAVSKINAKFIGIRTQIEVIVRHRVDDLSF